MVGPRRYLRRVQDALRAQEGDVEEGIDPALVEDVTEGPGALLVLADDEGSANVVVVDTGAVQSVIADVVVVDEAGSIVGMPASLFLSDGPRGPAEPGRRREFRELAVTFTRVRVVAG